jgi:hypothetical protein
VKGPWDYVEGLKGSMSTAKDAGWSESEVTSAMIGLSAELAASLVADRGTEHEVAVAQMLIAALSGKMPN